jgi:hypothetical protein
MAYLVRRAGGPLEIRETVATHAGPRARTLATFRGALTPEVLDLAAARARRPLDRAALEARAAALAVPVTARREDRAARELLAALRRGAAPDGVLVTLLRDALAPAPAAAVPAALADAAEWIGADAAARGRALRDLLRLSGRIAESRALRRERARERFPRFRSRRRRAAVTA